MKKKKQVKKTGTAKSKSQIMGEMRAERKSWGWVRKEIWIHKSRVDELPEIEEGLQNPKKG